MLFFYTDPRTFECGMHPTIPQHPAMGEVSNLFIWPNLDKKGRPVWFCSDYYDYRPEVGLPTKDFRRYFKTTSSVGYDVIHVIPEPVKKKHTVQSMSDVVAFFKEELPDNIPAVMYDTVIPEGTDLDSDIPETPIIHITRAFVTQHVSLMTASSKKRGTTIPVGALESNLDQLPEILAQSKHLYIHMINLGGEGVMGVQEDVLVNMIKSKVPDIHMVTHTISTLELTQPRN